MTSKAVLACQRIIAGSAKEWAEFRRDRLSLALAFLLPLATLLLFGYGVRLQPEHVPVLIQDRDNSSTSRKLTNALRETRFLSAIQNSNRSAEGTLRAGKAQGAFVVPAGFGDDVSMADPASFRTFIDGSDVTSAQVIKGVANAAALQGSAEVGDSEINAIKPDVEIRFNPDLKESLFIVPGVFGIVLFMYPALLAAVAASREIEQGTIIQIYASRMSALEMLIGKASIYFLVGAAEAAVVVLGARLIFGLPIPSASGLFVVSTAIYLLTAVFFGLVAGTFAKSQTVAVQATATGGFFPSLLLSGFVYPIANIPSPLCLLCLFVPARYYIELCRNLFLKNAGWESTAADALILCLFALCFATISYLLMRPMRQGGRHA